MVTDRASRPDAKAHLELRPEGNRYRGLRLGTRPYVPCLDPRQVGLGDSDRPGEATLRDVAILAQAADLGSERSPNVGRVTRSFPLDPLAQRQRHGNHRVGRWFTGTYLRLNAVEGPSRSSGVDASGDIGLGRSRSVHANGDIGFEVALPQAVGSMSRRTWTATFAPERSESADSDAPVGIARAPGVEAMHP